MKKHRPARTRQSASSTHRTPRSGKVQPPGVRKGVAREAPPALPMEPEALSDYDEQTKVVLLPVNPYLVYVYWGIGPRDEEEIGKYFRQPGRQVQPVLRFYDITSVHFDGTNARSRFDLEIDLRTGSWYVPLWSPAKTYCLDLGLRTETGEFHRLARSNVAETPRAGPSDKTEEIVLPAEAARPPMETAVRPIAPAEVAKTPMELLPVDKLPGTEEEGQEPEPWEIRIFRSAAPGEIERKVAEVYRQGFRQQPGPTPSQARGASPPSPGKRHVDLTELSERRFRAGVSSGKTASAENPMEAGNSSKP